MRGNERFLLGLRRTFSTSSCAAIKEGQACCADIRRAPLLCFISFWPQQVQKSGCFNKNWGQDLRSWNRKLWHWLQSGWLELSTHMTFGSRFLWAASALLYITILLCITLCLLKLCSNSRFGGLSPWGLFRSGGEKSCLCWLLGLPDVAR